MADLLHSTVDYRVAVCPIDGRGTLEQRIDRIRHLWEINGWDRLEVYERGEFGPRILFRKPKNALDATPFVDSNV